MASQSSSDGEDILLGSQTSTATTRSHRVALGVDTVIDLVGEVKASLNDIGATVTPLGNLDTRVTHIETMMAHMQSMIGVLVAAEEERKAKAPVSNAERVSARPQRPSCPPPPPVVAFRAPHTPPPANCSLSPSRRRRSRE